MYVPISMVFCYHNCSNILWKKIVLVWGIFLLTIWCYLNSIQFSQGLLRSLVYNWQLYTTVEFDAWNRRGFYFLILLYGTPPNTMCWLALLHVWSLRATLSSESKYPMHRDQIYHLLSGEFTAMFLFQNWCNNNDAQNITWILNNYLNSLNDLSGLNSSKRLLVLVVGSFLAPKWKMFLNFFIFRYTVPYADYWVCGVYEQPWAPSQSTY